MQHLEKICIADSFEKINQLSQFVATEILISLILCFRSRGISSDFWTSHILNNSTLFLYGGSCFLLQFITGCTGKNIQHQRTHLYHPTRCCYVVLMIFGTSFDSIQTKEVVLVQWLKKQKSQFLSGEQRRSKIVSKIEVSGRSEVTTIIHNVLEKKQHVICKAATPSCFLLQRSIQEISRDVLRFSSFFQRMV